MQATEVYSREFDTRFPGLSAELRARIERRIRELGSGRGLGS